ncbi:hypothetical protein [Chondromyces apiculatus]|uniref:Putative alanine and proline rich protein n=1 Tax=Chondromyces apiculatus DSM 436 TaxID=1192034 RepID=A0A017SUZ9_9BACT|nr:hypothetical protein [Chondromyces apiculatus]EYF00557.1 putative alanine and proline rich protein [Chondromyces apiculatus DSM 436]
MDVQIIYPERRPVWQGVAPHAGSNPLCAVPVLDVAAHLEAFRHGGAYILPESHFHRFVRGRATLGDPTGQFMATCATMDGILAACAGRVALLKRWLGIPPSTWNEPLYRVDVREPLRYRARLPTGAERGANAAFLRGGFTCGGLPEIVTDPFPSSAATISALFPGPQR